MAEPLVIQFAADTSRAQSAMASLASSIAGNMASVAVSMSGAAANSNSLGRTLDAVQRNAQRAAGAVGTDLRTIATATATAATAEKATLEGIVRAFTASAAASQTAQATVQAGLAGTTSSIALIAAQIPTLQTLFRAFIAFEIAKLVFEGVASSIDQARQHVEEFVKIGRDAERVGVGAEFFQRATLSAEKYGLTVDQVTQALRHAREAAEIRIGEGKDASNTSSFSNRLEQNVRAGNLTAADKALFDNAASQEAKIRVVLDLIDKLRAEARDPAAFDLAGKFFGADFERRLRDGIDLTGKLREAITSTSTTVAGIRIVGEDEIERANQLDAKAKDIANTFATALAPIQRDISNAVLDTYQAFLNVEAVIARVVTIAVDLYKQISAVVGEIKGFVNSIPYIGKVLTAGNVLTAAQEALRAVGALPPEEQGPPAPVTVRVSPRGGANANPLPSLHSRGGGSSSESLDAVETLINQLEKARDTAKAELDNVTQTNIEREKAVALAKAEAAAREDVKRRKRDSADLTEDERTRVLAAAEAMQRYKDAATDAQQALRQTADAARYFGDAAANGFADAVLEGKNLGDVLSSLIKQFERSALQALFTGQGPLAGFFGTAPAASAGSSAVGGLAGWATQEVKASGFGDFVSSFFRANGGPVQAGRAYTVGELGRELFVPNQDGRVIPIARGAGPPAAADGASRARPIQVSMVVQTPDAPSFARSEAQITAALYRAVQRGMRSG
ncbi:hypothetical protein [Methylobacterium nodulans]|uniref:Bacteriophage tail tape measure C-terminal domain-containing protein n=1 Tax=Methylobacterium nodulans (strain LMG 21967 / CNCM I-2342 / ORS 2060) TaxID=460265 RepID=B8ITA9_METNO|nr:hypothetical protein [Methylobacterium nodulans]ACL56995.1 hypothetical protein Mnod_2008 [Methylobacterium nodulans ORS 2060]